MSALPLLCRARLYPWTDVTSVRACEEVEARLVALGLYAQVTDSIKTIRDAPRVEIGIDLAAPGSDGTVFIERLQGHTRIVQATPAHVVEKGDPLCACVCRECRCGDHCGEGRQEGLGDCMRTPHPGSRIAEARET